MRAQVITPWIGTGASEDDANRPQLADDYAIQKWTDVTGQENIQPDPNLYIIEVEADESVITAIEADNTYQVLFSE